MTKIRFILIAFTVAMLACGRSIPAPRSTTEVATQSPAVPQTGSYDVEITSGGEVRHFRLHVPAEGASHALPLPLVLNFHGYGSNSLQEENLTGMSDLADREGFIVAYPDGLEERWAPGSGAAGQADLQFVRDIISFVETTYGVDPKRIFATGISNGGGMANRVGCDMADQIAAIAPDAGAYNFWQDCDPSRPLPVLAFHGLDDNVIPYAGGQAPLMDPPIEEWAAAWAARNGCDASPTESGLEGGVTVRTWSGCRENAEVVLYTLEDHGHSWPGSPVMPASITSQAVDATQVMWEFFEAHPMP